MSDTYYKEQSTKDDDSEDNCSHTESIAHLPDPQISSSAHDLDIKSDEEGTESSEEGDYYDYYQSQTPPQDEEAEVECLRAGQPCLLDASTLQESLALVSWNAANPWPTKRSASLEDIRMLKKKRTDAEIKSAELSVSVQIPSGHLSFDQREPQRGHLSRFDRILFWDYDNFSKDFPNILSQLPKESFTWVAYGGSRTWIEPDHEGYAKAKAKNSIYVNDNCGTERNAADFMISYWIGRLDAELPRKVKFILVSGDTGFRPIARKFEKSGRQFSIIEPHYLTTDQLILLINGSVLYKLKYFSMRGRAQALRYLAVDNNLVVRDDVVKDSEWPTLKPKMPMGQLPVFSDGDFHLGQSNAILRYVARKHGLYGKNEQEAALIDMINDQQEETRLAYLHLIYKEYDSGKEAFIKNLPTHLATFEKVLGEKSGGAGFFVGDKVSFVDYTTFDLLDNLVILAPHALDEFPKLKGFHSRIASRDKIAKYRTTEAFKKIPINGNGKQ